MIYKVNALHADDFEHSGFESMITEEIEAESQDAAVAIMRHDYAGVLWDVWASA